MFQIAATIGVSVKNGQYYQFPPWKYNKYFANKLPGLTTRLLVPIREVSFTYHPVHVFSGRNYDMHGFFQSEKYFSHCAPIIRKAFDFIPEIKTVKHIDKVAVHVRRGDYLAMPNHHIVLPMAYYYKAMVQFKGAKFLIFSDDIPWCKEQNWAGHDVSFSENKDEVQDLYDMSVCTHNIIANSSFSWWGAWLNQRPDRKVIAPKLWFGSQLRHDTKDLIPDTWRRI